MANLRLWELVDELKSDKYKWVDLTHELSPETPHWSGFENLEQKRLFDYPDGFLVHEFKLVSQYGTHVDAPAHFVEGRKGLNEIEIEEMVLPLIVIDVRHKTDKDIDYAVTVEDIKEFEAKYGDIPEKSFVAIRTDWSHREDMDNFDKDGNKHYPGWGLEAVKYLVEEKNVSAIGHETSDTDAAVDAANHGYICEYYILDQQRYQIELMKDLSEVPPVGAMVFCGFPKLKDGVGFTARCIAVCPKE